MPPESPPPDARPPPALAHRPSAERPLAGLTVLAVEDSRFACEGLRLMCMRLGARLRRAETLAAAAAHLRTYRPDVVVIDLGLPDGPGTDLIAGLVRLGPSRPLVIGMSGEDGAEARVRAAGAADFLAKPIDSLAAFRDTLLAHLPGRGCPPAQFLPPDHALPPPDLLALRDDLAHAASGLAQATPEQQAHLRRFVTGLARATGDPALEHAATGPTSALGPLLRARLAALSAIGLIRQP